MISLHGLFSDHDLRCVQEGEPLLQLPEKHIELLRIEFSEEEREVIDSAFSTLSYVKLAFLASCTTGSRNAPKSVSTNLFGRNAS